MVCPSCRAESLPGASRCGRCGQSLGALEPGTVFASRYQVISPLGQGGMGTVYKARDLELEETVALKVLRPDVVGTPQTEERFRSEIRLARRVSHRNVCRVYDYGSAGGLRYVSMALVDGVDLKRLLAARGGLPPDRAYDICAQVADGLQAIHDEGIVHRDLKSANVMVEPRGVARLMDFGIAKPLDPALAHGVTATGVIVGTPEYMSPEQALGGAVDERSDVYSLGIVVFEAFTGHVPFHGDTPVATILLHVQQPPPLEGAPAAGLPRELVPLLRRALAKTTAERPSSAREVADLLRAAWGERAAGEAVTPAAPPTVTLSGPAAGLALRATAPAIPPRTPPEATVAERRPLRGGPSWRRTVTLVVAAAAVVAAAMVASRMRPAAGGPTPPERAAAATATMAPFPATTAAAPTRAPIAASVVSPTPAAATPAVAPPPSRRDAPAPERPPAVASASPPSAPRPSEAFLVVVVVPWADITIDGAPVKSVPLERLPVAPGAHVVELRHPDYQVLRRVVSARPGETITLTVDLPEEGVRIGK